MRRTEEVKVLRDPIHGYIHVDSDTVWKAINSREFQRLHRIRQLGGDYQVYHTAEHSRFAHSLGVYEIVRRMITEVESLSEALSEKEKLEVMCAGLLHDLGHGPFSHSFEAVMEGSHEEMTCAIILDESTEINKALRSERADLPSRVAAIIRHEHPNPLLSEMISSQLDADRMDYLLRDAYETGTSYGTFDLERILRTMRVKDGHLCVKESGMHSVEDYIMARYHMYWQVYLHPDARSFEILLAKFFTRVKCLQENGVKTPALDLLDLNGDYLDLDDYRVMTAAQLARHEEDGVLADLAERLLARHLFAWIEQPDEATEQKVVDELAHQHLDPDYYFYAETSSSRTYMPYREDHTPIRILCPDGELYRLSDLSNIVAALEKMETRTKRRIYFPKGLI